MRAYRLMRTPPSGQQRDGDLSICFTRERFYFEPFMSFVFSYFRLSIFHVFTGAYYPGLGVCSVLAAVIRPGGSLLAYSHLLLRHHRVSTSFDFRY